MSDEHAGLSSGVLKNKLGITDQRTLDDAEALLLPDAYEHFFTLLARGELVFGSKLLLQIHQFIFGPLYAWAGKIRTVDISKDGMLFVPVKYIATSLRDTEKILSTNIASSKKSHRTYIVACKAGMMKEYEQMERVIFTGLAKQN